jgi:WD40 repeat protein
MSRDGATFAYLVFDTKTSQWRATVVDLKTSTSRVIDRPIANHLNPTLGFVDSHRLLLNTQPNGQTWQIDTARSDAITALGAPATHMGGIPAVAYGGNLHVVGLGTWLYVRNTKTDDAVYLGYDAFDPSWVALSETGKFVAWATNRGTVYVESLSNPQGKSVRIEGDAMAPVWRLGFAGDDRLITADSVGGIQMYDWRKGSVLDSADSGGPIQHLEVSVDGTLLRVVRQMGETWLFDIDSDKLEGPHVVDDASNRSGFLAAEGDRILWTLDSANKYRTYTRAEARGSLSREDMLTRGTVNKTTPPMAIGYDEMFYTFVSKGTRSELTRNAINEAAVTTFTIPSASVFSVLPSPDGSKVAVMRDTGILVMYDTATAKQLWSFSFLQNTSILAWSADSSRIASASFSGAAALSAQTGKSLRTTCAPWFSVRRTAPPNSFSSQNAQLCAR